MRTGPTEPAVLRLVDGQSLADLGRYAARARAVDADGAIRLVVHGGVLAAWVAVATGAGLLGQGAALGLRTFAVVPDGVDLDVVVPVGAVADRAARDRHSGREEPTALPVPPVRANASWAGLTPPRSGWESVGTTTADVLVAVARAGIDEVSHAVAQRGAAGGLARDRVWSQPLSERVTTAAPSLAGPVGSVASRAAFAAYALGFLPPGCEVTVWATNRWTRLSAPGGHVLLR